MHKDCPVVKGWRALLFSVLPVLMHEMANTAGPMGFFFELGRDHCRQVAKDPLHADRQYLGQ